NVHVIQTSFDRQHSGNLCSPAQTNRVQNITWTERERRKAEAGYVVQDLDDLCNKVPDSSYIHIPINIFQRQLDLRNSDDSLMVFICSSLPDRIRKNLTSALLACFDGREVLLDTVVENVLKRPFQCLHFSLWNRYVTNV
ncbi:hypothetical protein P692DRAFT_20678788, partial [Suillus brevipes Sb2]